MLFDSIDRVRIAIEMGGVDLQISLIEVRSKKCNLTAHRKRDTFKP